MVIGNGKRREEGKFCNIQVVENIQLPICANGRGTQGCHVPAVGDSTESISVLEG